MIILILQTKAETQRSPFIMFNWWFPIFWCQMLDIYVHTHVCKFPSQFCLCVCHTQAQTDNMKTATIRKRTHLCLKPALLLTEVFLFFGLTTADALELPDAALPLVSSAPSTAVLHCPQPRHSARLLETIAAGSCWLSLPLSSRLDPACSVLSLTALHWTGSSSLWLSCPPMSPFAYQQRSKFSAHSGSVLSHLSSPLSLSPSQTLCSGPVNALPLVIMCPSASRVSPHIQYITMVVFL